MSNTKTADSSMAAATTYSLLSSLILVLALAAGGYFAYQQGYLDPLIEKVGVVVFRAKAAAEEKELQAEGMKAGEDFVDCKSISHLFSGASPGRRGGRKCCLAEGRGYGYWGLSLLTRSAAAQLKGNQQADEVKQGLGSIGSLKKDL